MPKDKRRRTELHASSAKLPKRQFAVQENAVEYVNIGEASNVSSNDILHSLSAPQTHTPSISKKEKQATKREAFMQKLTSGLSPYSKSHARRLKRRANEQIAGGLSDIKAAITELVEDMPIREPPDTTSITTMEPKPKKHGKIGEGKNVPLTAPQRKRALKIEQKRQPLILSNPAFASNPFQAVRTHAENTLVKRQASSSYPVTVERIH